MKINVRPIIHLEDETWKKLKVLTIKEDKNMSITLGSLLDKTLEQRKYRRLNNG